MYHHEHNNNICIVRQLHIYLCVWIYSVNSQRKDGRTNNMHSLLFGSLFGSFFFKNLLWKQKGRKEKRRHWESFCFCRPTHIVLSLVSHHQRKKERKSRRETEKERSKRRSSHFLLFTLLPSSSFSNLPHHFLLLFMYVHIHTC